MIRHFALSALVVCGLSSVASAQLTATASTSTAQSSLAIAAFDPDQAVAPISVVEGPGWKVGEGTVLHPTFGLETGFESNVFYQSANETPSGVLRLLGQIETASLSTARLDPNADPFLASQGPEPEDDHGDKGDLQYQLSVRLAYDQLLSGDQIVRDTGGLGMGALFRMMANPMGTVSLGIDENFVRLIRAPNFETDGNENRDLNTARVNVFYHPAGRSFAGYGYYSNVIDIFENSENLYPDRMDHRFGVHPMWQWLPQTQLYGDLSFGVISGIGSSGPSMMKVTSYPLTGVLGIATLLSLKTTLNVSAGYTNGFYSTGPSFSAPTVSAVATYRYSPLGRLGVGYNLLYIDSVNANYYRDHLLRAFIQQGFDPFVIMIQPELHFREYNGLTVPGPTTRDDTIFAITGGIHYNFRDWIAATLNYKFSTVQTDYRYMDAMGDTIDPSYVRHELLAGVRVAM